MKKLISAAVAVAVMGGAAIFLAPKVANKVTEEVVHEEAGGEALIGGPFELVDQNGKTVRDADFRGKFMIVFFGFTHCPDVCPTNLAKLGEILEGLGDDANKIAPLFVSLDQERDTVERLKEYASAFDERIIFLTGSKEQLDKAAKEYKVYSQKVPAQGPGAGGQGSEPGYQIDHSAFIYLMDGEGKYRAHFVDEEDTGKIVAAIRGELKN